VTHDQVEALTLGHRVAVMKDGRILQVGPPFEVYRLPADTFVATFIGSPPMNLFPAAVQPGGLLIAETFFPLPHALLPLRPGQPCTAGIRPEHWRPAFADEPALALGVAVVELLGPTVQVGGYMGQTWATVLLPADARPQAGDTLRLTFSPVNLCLFAHDSGKRLYP
ncbi:MAG: TOBE domain-containing protein, partial [Thermoanaerobaculum sp.]